MINDSKGEKNKLRVKIIFFQRISRGISDQWDFFVLGALGFSFVYITGDGESQYNFVVQWFGFIY